MNVSHLRQKRKGRIVLHIVVVKQSAVAVACVLAQAYVGNNDNLRNGSLYRLNGAAYKCILSVCKSAFLVLQIIFDNSEKQHFVYAERVNLFYVGDECIDRETEDSRH